ncbi:hypothetical protein JCM3770_007120 [Rhodotorula araucariae]
MSEARENRASSGLVGGSGLVPPAQLQQRDSGTRSVGRSQSLNQAQSSSGAPGGAQVGALQGYTHVGQLGAVDEGGERAGAALTRGSNTVSAASRLVRLERNRARLALQGVGLSEEDQEFYVPPSPVRGGSYPAWSDLDLGGISAAAPSSTISPAAHTAAFSPPHVEAAWNRAAEQEQHVATPATVGAGSGQGVQPEPKRSSFVVLRGGKGDQALTERRSHQPQLSTSSQPAASLPTSPVQPAPGDGAAPNQPLRHKNSLKPFLEQEREQLGGRDVEEDWERGLLDERRSGAEGPGAGDDEECALGAQQDPYSLTTPPLSSSFSSQLSSPFAASRQPSTSASSYHTHQPRRNVTADPWLPGSGASAVPSLGGSGEDDPSLIRRHQSLNSFQRGGRQREASIEQTLSSSPASAGGWGDAGAVYAVDDVHQPRALGSLTALAGAPSIAGFGSRTRAGASPAPLALQHSQSLGHGPSTSTSSPSLSGARLAHSNSLSAATGAAVGGGVAAGLQHSHSLGSRSDSGAAAARALSPVVSAFGGARSPWSPTEEETKQLGMNTSFGSSGAPGGGGGGGSGTLSRGGSTSSRGSHSHVGEYATGPVPPVPTGGFADEVRRLDTALGAMQLGAMLSAAAAGGAGLPLDRNSPSPHALHGQGARRLAPLMTSADALGAQLGGGGSSGFANWQGPASAAAFVPPIGHSHLVHPYPLDGISEYAPQPLHPQQQQQQHMTMGLGPQPMQSQASTGSLAGQGAFAPFDPSTGVPYARGNLTAVPGGVTANDWLRQKELLVGGAATPTASSSGVALPFAAAGGPNAPLSAATPVPGPFSSAPLDASAPGVNGWPSPAALQQMKQQQRQIHVLQSQMAQALSAMDAMRAQGAVLPANFDIGAALRQQQQMLQEAAQEAPAETPIDVNSLVAKKGYNPAVFDLQPAHARFFVIKSYTEEDVHKSLKYEIWASTDLGNKRLDRAFRESADKGPIYLFFSVNASGHFAGMAQMLTPVDYSMSSSVWASDKWKGVLKVRWIYIKDVPLSALRHIRLSNTPENKPVTSSRDTQEVPYDAGLEVLRIIAGYQSRTSLLQDYAWYEAQFRRQQAAGGAEGDPAAQAPMPQIPPHYASTASSQPSNTPQQQQQQAGDMGPRQQQGGRRFWNRGAPAPAPTQQQPPQPVQVPGNGVVRGPPPHLTQAQPQGYYVGAQQPLNGGVAY